MKALKLVGEKFGKLTVESQCTEGFAKRTKWNCVCACGNKLVVRAVHLQSGHTRSCGCLRRENRASVTHGMTYSTEYNIWAGVIQRCLNPNSGNYPHYGGRGINVCKEWKNSFERFYADMGPRPLGKTLDRINNNKGYSKNNCRWASYAEQVANRRPKYLSVFWTVGDFTGVTTDVARHFGISYASLWARMKRSKETAAQAVEHILAYRERNGFYGRSPT